MGQSEDWTDLENEVGHTLPSTEEDLGQSGDRVRIVGDHPHRGETGTVRDDKPMKMGMWEIDLDPESRGVNGCFAGPENLRSLDPSEDPHA